jgi:hypothetical protein
MGLVGTAPMSRLKQEALPGRDHVARLLGKNRAGATSGLFRTQLFPSVRNPLF